MKTTNLLLLLCLMLLSSCNNDSNDSPNFNEQLLKRFPNATNVVWRTSNNYQVATFSLAKQSKAQAQPGKVNEAWFQTSGDCVMTEIEIPISELPAAVVAGWEATTFFKDKYQLDDIDKLERDGNVMYKLEVETTKDEYELFFSIDGKLMHSKLDADDTDIAEENIPTPKAISDFILGKYKDAKIIECELEEDKANKTKFYEVEFIDKDATFNDVTKKYDGEKEAIFDINKKWSKTIQEIEYKKLPSLISASFEKTYPQYKGSVDEIEITEKTTGIIYVFTIEIEGSEIPKIITFDEKGKEVK
ncbi:MAG: PepSY-like domain-containing protein [Bacteroidaceae bacterium]